MTGILPTHVGDPLRAGRPATMSLTSFLARAEGGALKSETVPSPDDSPAENFHLVEFFLLSALPPRLRVCV